MIYSNLHFRAEILKKIRTFFDERGILEVETPLLSKSTITDPNLHSIEAFYTEPGSKTNTKLYLQTSPEFAMKRLLAAGSGSIYQICKAFRNEECGKFHNPEFTMLEWYHVGFNHHDLMDEMDSFLNWTINADKAERLSYLNVFQKFLNINPHTASLDNLKNCAVKNNLELSSSLEKEQDRDVWLNLLLTNLIEPYLGNNNQPTFIYDYPATQAALAQIRNDDIKIAERFEVYINGIEIANGFHELKNANEQRLRFEKDLETRKKLGLPTVPIDENLLTALEYGLPDCAGVALGIDRLLMIALNANSINEVITGHDLLSKS